MSLKTPTQVASSVLDDLDLGARDDRDHLAAIICARDREIARAVLDYLGYEQGEELYTKVMCGDHLK